MKNQLSRLEADNAKLRTSLKDSEKTLKTHVEKENEMKDHIKVLHNQLEHARSDME
jgi:hypothetical protein